MSLKSDQCVPSYKNKFLAAQKGIEGVIVEVTFKQIVSRLVGHQDELRQPENMVLKCSFINYYTYK